MAKDDEMRSDQVVKQRARLDRRTSAVLKTWADLAGRTDEAHLGILLRRLTELYENKPDVLLELGLVAKAELQRQSA